MPLLDITLKPGYRLKLTHRGDSVPATESTTRTVVKYTFSRALPLLLVRHLEALGLDSDTPPEGIQIMNHDYGKHDVNVANIWVKAQFSEDRPELAERLRIRDRLYSIIVGWFVGHGFVLENFVLDIFWGPTNGKGVVNGVPIEW